LKISEFRSTSKWYLIQNYLKLFFQLAVFLGVAENFYLFIFKISLSIHSGARVIFHYHHPLRTDLILGNNTIKLNSNNLETLYSSLVKKIRHSGWSYCFRSNRSCNYKVVTEFLVWLVELDLKSVPKKNLWKYFKEYNLTEIGVSFLIWLFQSVIYFDVWLKNFLY